MANTQRTSADHEVAEMRAAPHNSHATSATTAEVNADLRDGIGKDFGVDTEDMPSVIASWPTPAGPPIHPDSMADIVKLSVSRQSRRQWSIDDLDWAGLRPERLNDADRSAVRFITLIEDHIPGYLGFFLQAFPTAGAEQAIEEFCFNREYFRFLIAWANDEERHAAVLTRYQLEAG